MYAEVHRVNKAQLHGLASDFPNIMRTFIGSNKADAFSTDETVLPLRQDEPWLIGYPCPWKRPMSAVASTSTELTGCSDESLVSALYVRVVTTVLRIGSVTPCRFQICSRHGDRPVIGARSLLQPTEHDSKVQRSGVDAKYL
jgi:hypothetical protein